MSRYKKWAERRYGKKERMVALVVGGIIFWVAVPLLIIIGSYYFDQWFGLPKFVFGLINSVVSLILMVAGWLFANWTVKVQFSVGHGTPIPLMATQKLIVRAPYTYCRNPMTLGTALFYLGVGIGLGSLSAVGLSLVYPAGILIYIKLIEEKELEERFGSQYLDYKRKTPFLIPRLRKKEWVK